MKVYVEGLKIKVKDERDFITTITDFDKALEECQNAIAFHKEKEKIHDSITYPEAHKRYKELLSSLNEFAKSHKNSKCDSSLRNIIGKRAFWGTNIFQAKENFGYAEIFVYDWKGRFEESFFVKSIKYLEKENPILYQYSGDLEGKRADEFLSAFRHDAIW